jgi:hypothetical protein
MLRVRANAAILVCVLLLLGNVSPAQSLNIPAEGMKNTIGTAFSGGVFLDKDAVFWGVGLDYSRVFNENWIINFSFSYDQEHEQQDSQGTKVTNTLSPSIAIGYAFNERLAVGIGLGKGMFDDDNSENKLKYNKNGNWTVGLIGAYSFYQNGPHSFDISGGVERGLSEAETDLTIEIGYGYSF